MKMRMLKHCDHCGKLQLMTFDEKRSYGPFGNLKTLFYVAKCKKCKHYNIHYKEV